MPFIPHTAEDIQQMLASTGVSSINDLFDEIPASLRNEELSQVGPALNEMQITRLMQQRANLDQPQLNFIGAGAYEHHIPAAVWEIATRGEFYSAYTPYQAEASQGTLQVLYEYQTMISSLTGMDASNASLYDGASALAEAILMATRSHKSARRILLPANVSPFYRRVAQNIVGLQNIELVSVDYDSQTGNITAAQLAAHQGSDIAALVIPQPNFFGGLEDVDMLTNWAHQQGALVIGLVNPVSLALLKAPGQWGDQGADMAVGDGQPLGAPLSSGGPYFGFLCCKKALVRQMPGRIVGRTVDLDGKVGYTLTLQAREQHIRRAKATSNICSNQGLVVTAATIHMAIMGLSGLQQVARSCHRNTDSLAQRLAQIPGVSIRFHGPRFHELVIDLGQAVQPVLNKLAAQQILGGFDLSAHYPELGNCLLVCATETKTEADLQLFADSLKQALL